MNVDTIAVLGFGEGGSAIGRGLADTSGWLAGAPRRQVLAVDIALDKDPRGRALGDKARGLGVAIADGYTQVLRSADAVFSVVTGEEALNAARAAAPHLKPGALYLDLCTITRDMALADMAALEGSGVRYVDVAVMGTFLGFGYKAPMLLAGEHAEAASAWMNSLGFDTKVLGPKPGSASAVKLLRSIMMKGIEALGVECLVAARRQGLLDEVLDNVGDVDKMSFAKFVSMLVTTHTVHARRRMEEMELVERMLQEIGMAPLMTAATVHSHGRTVDADAMPPDGRVPDLEGALALLTDRVVKPVARA